MWNLWRTCSRQHGEVSVVRAGAGRVSTWPEPEIGARYKILNGTSREGQVGECVAKRESPFGHKWAVLAFEDGARVSVRTVLLEAEGEARVGGGDACAAPSADGSCAVFGGGVGDVA